MLAIRVGFLVVALLGSLARGAEAQTTHLKCYKASDPLGIRGPGPAWLALDAGSLGEEHCRIVSGFRLVCVPSAASISAPIEGRLFAGPYTPLTPVSLPNEEVLNQDRLCYKIRCVERPSINNDTAFTDEFGARKLSRYKPFLMCGPAEASLCGDGHLDFGEECDDGNRTSGDCCSASCHAEPNTQSCGPDTDGNECTTPRCDGAGACVQTGLLEPDTTPCTDTDGNSCTQARCDGTGACTQDGFLEPTTTSCTDTDGNSCTRARCGGAGVCSQTGFLEPPTTACTDTDGNSCTQARCNGAGACSQVGFLEPNTTACADTDGNECTTARCNGSGNCSQTAIVTPDGTPCTDTDGNVCTHALCEAGACDQSVNVALGTTCPDTDGDQCDLPGCDENGLCAQDFFVRNCNLPEVCEPSTGVCQ